MAQSTTKLARFRVISRSKRDGRSFSVAYYNTETYARERAFHDREAGFSVIISKLDQPGFATKNPVY